MALVLTFRGQSLQHLGLFFSLLFRKYSAVVAALSAAGVRAGLQVGQGAGPLLMIYLPLDVTPWQPAAVGQDTTAAAFPDLP